MKKVSYPAASADYHEVKKEDLLYIANTSPMEMLGALASALKPASADKVILTGCKIIDSNTSVEIQSGFIFYNGEIYRVIGSTYVFPGGLDEGEDPLENVWIVGEAQSLPNADRTYRDARTHTVFTETAMKLSGSSSGALFRLDELAYYANSEPSGSLKFWRPTAEVTLADVVRMPSGKGKGVFLGWQLVGDSGGRTLMGMNWDESAFTDVRAEADYLDIDEKGGKKSVLLTPTQTALVDHVHVQQGYTIIDSGSNLAVGGSDIKKSTLNGVSTQGVTGGAANAAQAHENRMPFLMAYIWQKI